MSIVLLNLFFVLYSINLKRKTMFRTDTQERYKLFLNEMLDYSQAELPVSSLELIRKYGVSGRLTQFLQHAGYFTATRMGKQRLWQSKKTTPFTDGEVRTLINEFNRYKYKLKNPEVGRPSDHQIVNDTKKCSLNEYSTQELFDELRARGYTGTLYFQKAVKI